MLERLKTFLGVRGATGAALDDLHRAAEASASAGQLARAAEQFQVIIKKAPADARAYYGLGDALYQLGRNQEALAALQEAVRAGDPVAQYHYKLGNVLKDLGQVDAAIDHYRRAIALDPEHARALNNMGVELEARHRFGEAQACYRKALRADPQLHPAQTNLAALLQRYGDPEEAAQLFQAALAAGPGSVEVLVQYSNLLATMDRPAESAAAAREALALAPDCLDAKIALCRISELQGDRTRAISCYTDLLAQGAESALLHHNLGSCHIERGSYDEAERSFNRALALEPDFADSHFSLASVYLLQARFDRGWDEYEWRWRLPRFLASNPARFERPLWDANQPLHDKTVLVHAEQGFGDTLQFSRYLPLLQARCRKLIVQCPARVQRIIRTVPGVTEVAAEAPANAYDVHIPLLSLPRAFGTRVDTIPASVPYLFPPRELVQRWESRLAGVSGLKVGLAWESHGPGNANPGVIAGKSAKSIRSELLAPLFELDGVKFVSLQRNGRMHFPAGLKVASKWLDWGDEQEDFADTAALMEALDLVVSIDTAVAHLAGALGKPVWTLLLHRADWRWMRERDTSPWYPTMRLFRQPGAGDWASVIASVRDSLRECTARRSATDPIP